MSSMMEIYLTYMYIWNSFDLFLRVLLVTQNVSRKPQYKNNTRLSPHKLTTVSIITRFLLGKPS